jgi:pimeloyl-ACP methyl ester carboxylesterase
MRGDGAPPPPIPHPTRVRWGASEPFMKPDYADRLGETFTDLDYAVVPEAGHFVHYEQPDFTNREIAGFFGGLAAARRFTPTIAES